MHLHLNTIWFILVGVLLTGYPLLVGVTTIALFMMHGAIYGVMNRDLSLLWQELIRKPCDR